ncbi:hypothetical protein BDV96DRAFT_579215 [Lophiotrema nucula]|uniref:Uncharacterized protein n=1 Tax=Lophiotrema nucula TaxID=690887 RepID=A0A6A5Z177_9PLEO|nr:hypothetical protein BDV96DRAFT_579215 [Lophiotrema nucula]
MLRRVRTLINPQISRYLNQEFPDVGVFFGAPLRDAEWIWRLPPKPRGTEPGLGVLDTLRDTIETALEMVKAAQPTEFAEPVAGAFRQEYVTVGNENFGPVSRVGDIERPLFVEGSLDQILTWKPRSWSIPSGNELTSLESNLSDPGRTYDGSLGLFQHKAKWIRWFFSAAAVAIRFLEKLSPQYRTQICKIILLETSRSVA